MLEVDAVSVRLGEREVLHDVSLAVEEANTVALLGPVGLWQDHALARHRGARSRSTVVAFASEVTISTASRRTSATSG